MKHLSHRHLLINGDRNVNGRFPLGAQSIGYFGRVLTLLLAGDSVVVSTNSAVRVGTGGVAPAKMEMFYPPDERRRRRVGPRCLFVVAFFFSPAHGTEEEMEEEKAATMAID